MSSITKEDWIECTFKELTLSLKRGPFGGDLKKSFFVESGFPVYEQQHAINDDYSNIRYFIDDERFEKLKACNVGPGDYIVSCSGTMGKISRIPNNVPKGVINQALLRIRLNDEIMLHNYFIQYFKSSLFQKKILKDSRGSGMQNMAGIKELKPITISIPPLVEQRAIVKKIEALFSSLDSGIEDLKKAQNQLVIYRQAVLKKAFDLNLKGHKIQEICKEIFAGGDKPKDFFSKTKTKELTIPILANAVANNGLYGYTKMARVNELAITIAGRGSGTGHVELRDEPFVPIVRLITLIPDLEKVVPKYLMYFLKNLNIKGTGSAIPQLTIPTVKSYVINLPSLEKQHQIVQEIESRLSVCDTVEKDISDSLDKAQALRQSILKKAFEGKLLNEDEIAKCKADKEYEPASVLLEKIKAEKRRK